MIRIWRAWTTERDVRTFSLFLVTVTVFLFVGLGFYSFYEGWTFANSFFFIVTTLSTVGYGHPVPSDDVSRLFTMIFILVGIYVIFSGISNFFHSNLDWLRRYICPRTVEVVEEEIVIGDIFHYRRLLAILLFFSAVWVVVGALVVKYNENETISWISAFYFMIETSSTVGFGDIIITNTTTRSFMTLYIIVSTILLAGSLRMFNATLEEIDQLDDFEERLCLLADLEAGLLPCKEKSEAENIECCGVDDDEIFSREKVVLDILCHIGVIDDDDVKPWMQKIDRLTRRGKIEMNTALVVQLCEDEREEAIKKLLELEEKRATSWCLRSMTRTQWRKNGDDEHKDETATMDNSFDSTQAAAGGGLIPDEKEDEEEGGGERYGGGEDESKEENMDIELCQKPSLDEFGV